MNLLLQVKIYLHFYVSFKQNEIFISCYIQIRQAILKLMDCSDLVQLEGKW